MTNPKTSPVAESVVEQCPECRSRHYARIVQRDAAGKFVPGPEVRCIECKTVRTLFTRTIEDDTPTDAGLVGELVEALEAASWLLADISPDGLVKQKVDSALSKAKDTR